MSKGPGKAKSVSVDVSSELESRLLYTSASMFTPLKRTGNANAFYYMFLNRTSSKKPR
jgi:hypothetical protein